MNDPAPALANPPVHEHVVRTTQMPRRRRNAPGPDTEAKLHVNQEG